MSLDELRAPFVCDFGTTTQGTWLQLLGPVADGRLVALPQSGGTAAFGFVINPDDPQGGTITTFGLASVTPTFGGSYGLPIYIAALDELWAFANRVEINVPAAGNRRHTLEALIIDCSTMTASRVTVAGPTVIATSQVRSPWQLERTGYDPSTDTIYIVGGTNETTPGPVITNYAVVTTIDASSRTATLPSTYTAVATSGDLPGGNGCRMLRVGSYMLSPTGPTSGLTNRVVRVDASSLAYDYVTPLPSNMRHGQGVVISGTAYWPPGNSSDQWLITSDGSSWTRDDDGLTISSAEGWSSAHEGPDGRVYAIPQASSINGILVYDPGGGGGEFIHRDVSPINQGGGVQGGAMTANGNFFWNTNSFGRIVACGLRASREGAAATPDPRVPARQFAPASAGFGGGVQVPQSGLDEPFAKWTTANWDGGWWLENEGTAGDIWDGVIVVQGDSDGTQFTSPLNSWWPSEWSRIWFGVGWRGATDWVDDDWGGPLVGADCKPMTLIFAFGEWDGHADDDVLYNEMILRKGSTNWTMLFASFFTGIDDHDPDGFLSLNHFGGSGGFLTFETIGSGDGYPDSPDLAGRLLVVTMDAMLGGMNLWIDGEPFAAPDVLGTDYTWADGSSLEFDQTYAAVASDRASTHGIGTWSRLYHQIGQNNYDGVTAPAGVPWTGVALVAYARGEPTKEDMAAYYAEAYPSKSLPAALT
jgi:hypothetical protein